MRAMKNFIPFRKRRASVSVIRLAGTIAPGRRSLSDEAFAPVIAKAFGRKPTAVALVINCPGGVPVQSSMIAARIRRHAEKEKVPVHSFIEDLATSGGYWLACAADRIWLDRSSIAGSIGVLTSSFGATEFIGRHGIERRVYAAGESKSVLDPFLPVTEQEEARVRAMQEQVHAAFIDHVKASRGGKLADVPVFGGELFVGRQAVEAGLADDIGHLIPSMKDLYGDKVRFRYFAPKHGPFGLWGPQIVGGAIAAVENRMNHARFGL